MNDKTKPEAQAGEDAVRDALRMAVRQNSHDMLMTGEEIRECEAALRTPPHPEAQVVGELPADVQRIIDRDWFDYVDASHDAQQPDYSDSPTAREAAARELLAAGWKWEHNKWQQPAVVGDGVHVRTGVFDSSGTEICAGDRIVICICGEHTKEEYWNPEYVVVWKAPRFTLKWVGGGKDSDTATWYFGLGTQQGYEKLELLERPAALTPAATPDYEGHLCGGRGYIPGPEGTGTEYDAQCPDCAATPGEPEEYEFEVFQGGAWQAGGSAPDFTTAQAEANHYAMMYGQDGPEVEVKFYARREVKAAQKEGNGNG